MPDRADLVVVGAGTVGGWASYFARKLGAESVIVLEKHLAGQGASSRAAGVVRAQGGTPATVALGRWSIAFYNSQRDELSLDSGFREHGYLLLAVGDQDVAEGKKRVEMQRSAGLDVRWVGADEAVRLTPTLASNGHQGGSYLETDGAIAPARNVIAYCLAMDRAGVELRERTAFTGLCVERSASGSARVSGVKTSAGRIETKRVILTGGPGLSAIGRSIGARIPVGGARHQVAVTETHRSFDVERHTMVFDLGAGLYWRLEEGGLLFGMSNSQESPGEARAIDWPYLQAMRARLESLVPDAAGLALRKVWAATIDYTPDHLPILGPVIEESGATIEGATIAAPGGHGMMWGPAVARVAADLALEGRTEIIDTSELGLDRFDGEGKSRLATDPVALPFPVDAGS